MFWRAGNAIYIMSTGIIFHISRNAGRLARAAPPQTGMEIEIKSEHIHCYWAAKHGNRKSYEEEGGEGGEGGGERGGGGGGGMLASIELQT